MRKRNSRRLKYTLHHYRGIAGALNFFYGNRKRRRHWAGNMGRKLIYYSGWMPNPINGKNRVYIEKEGQTYHVSMEWEGGMFLPPAAEGSGILSFYNSET